MDSINPLPADGLDAVHQNGGDDEPSNSGEDGVSNGLDSQVPETTETVALNGNFENFDQSDSATTGNSALKETEGTNDSVDGNNLTVSKDGEVLLFLSWFHFISYMICI